MHTVLCTLILEKARHPRPKLCVVGLVIDAEVILQNLDLDVSEVQHVEWHEKRQTAYRDGAPLHIFRLRTAEYGF